MFNTSHVGQNSLDELTNNTTKKQKIQWTFFYEVTNVKHSSCNIVKENKLFIIISIDQIFITVFLKQNKSRILTLYQL